MKQDNRVLNRVGARNLTNEEIAKVSGGLRTETVCTIDGASLKDGDVRLGEC
ncbi:MAG TPA: hypothetical protein VF532_12860 [Candidatus Angelobacter sp.]